MPHHPTPHPGLPERAFTAAARLAAVAELAAILPAPTRDELLVGADNWQQPPYAPTEIVPGLHQGGTEDNDVLSARARTTAAAAATRSTP